MVTPPYLVRSAFLGDEFRGSSGAHSKNGRAKAVVGEELDFAKIGIVLVILAAVALKAERLKIIELVAPPLLRGAIWSTWSGLSFAVDPRSKQTIQSPNITPVLLAPITGSN
jgi:hypothetical protein